MSGMMLHGLGDCTPELNCGCMAKSPRDVLRERIAQALYVEHSRRYGVALARWSESHPSYYADADAVIAALGLIPDVTTLFPGADFRRYITPWERIEEDG